MAITTNGSSATYGYLTNALQVTNIERRL